MLNERQFIPKEAIEASRKRIERSRLSPELKEVRHNVIDLVELIASKPAQAKISKLNRIFLC